MFFLFKLSLRVLSSPEDLQLGSWIFPMSPSFLRPEWQAAEGQELGSGIQSQKATISLQCWRPLTPSPEPRDKAAFHRDQHTRIGLVLKPQPGFVLGICFGTCSTGWDGQKVRFPGCWALTISILYNSIYHSTPFPTIPKESACLWPQGSGHHPSSFSLCISFLQEGRKHPSPIVRVLRCGPGTSSISMT